MRRKFFLIIGLLFAVFISVIAGTIILIILPLLQANETLDSVYCERIRGPLRSPRVDCYSNLGMKLAVPTLCQKIDDPLYLKEKMYCEAVASRDINKCERIPGFRRDFCIAVLTKDISYCDDISQGQGGCRASVKDLSPYIK